MEWIKDKSSISSEARVAIKSWCKDLEPDALQQAANLAAHPVIDMHVALMADCHIGYGMPIGGVIACRDAVIPNAVGVDIGCGMGAVETSLTVDEIGEAREIRGIINAIKLLIPVGEGKRHAKAKSWYGFAEYEDEIANDVPDWFDRSKLDHDRKNLGTLGGGNHFIEIQASEDDRIWLMLHSGSRNLGYRIASYYNKLAIELNSKDRVELPCKDLAFLSTDSKEGQNYIRDMNFALRYASENRAKMMAVTKTVMAEHFADIKFAEEINIHHNYAAYERHFGHDVWIHRKGATSARKGELGIIPGSMGASSCIVRGLGNPESFNSCSHGAGRKMGRMQASRLLTLEECDRAMEGIVFDRWGKVGGFGRKKAKGATYDFGEAPQAYKDIDAVIRSQLDLIEPLVKLRPLGVIKG